MREKLKFAGGWSLDQFFFSLHTNLKLTITLQKSTPFTPGSICYGGLTFKDFETENLITKNLTN